MLTKEDLEFRRDKIGASDAAAILGISPWTTEYDLWKQKVFGEETKSTFATKRGDALEEPARAEFERMTGLAVMPKRKVNPLLEWQIATFDGITFDEDVFVEIKCPKKEDHEMALKGQVPSYYFCQLQHQLCVAGLDKAFYFSFDGKRGALVEVKRDQIYIDDMIEKELAFLECVKNKVPPCSPPVETIIREDAEWVNAAVAFRKVKDQLRFLETKEKELKKILVDLGNGTPSKGGGVQLSFVKKEGSIDWTKIPELSGKGEEYLNQFRKPGIEYWSVR